MLYTPRQALHLNNLCESEQDHLWRPMPDVQLSADQWKWTCARCEAKLDKAPVPAAAISLRELERMVDDSLRIADHVYSDDQSVKGELWTMRSALWQYFPYKYHIIYHVLRGLPFVILFRYQNAGRQWRNILDTDTYRNLLEESDRIRVSHEPRISG